MQINVRLFSILREKAGTGSTSIDLASGATVAQALGDLRVRLPGLARFLEGAGRVPVLVAVNREYAKPATELREGDELALLPPVSGGGGLGHGLLLLSGGFDSPVAGHLVISGGRTLDAVHYTMEPFTDDASVHKARRLAAILGVGRLWVVPLGAELAEFTRRCEHGFYFVLLKRLMVRVAQRLAERSDARFLVTGENLGQVSSQTLGNLAVIDAAAALPVLRPLLGLDKHEIIALANRIGTFETSKGPELCDLLGPRHPATSTRLEEILAEEAKADVDGLVEQAIGRARAEPVAPLTRPVAG